MTPETAKDILDRHAKLRGYASYEDMILLGNPFYIQEVVESALPEIADKAFDAGHLWACSQSINTHKVYLDKSTYMKQLFPE